MWGNIYVYSHSNRARTRTCFFNFKEKILVLASPDLQFILSNAEKKNININKKTK